MLGEYLGEIRGRVTGIRVLPPEGSDPAIEYSIQGQGKLLGVDLIQMATDRSVASAGLYEARGNGVIVTDDGELIKWTGQGTGRPLGPRGASFRGARFYRTRSQKLARFDGLVAIFEVEVDNDGNVIEKFWQWK